jgi:ankyrin repeat domain-containing protein 50
MRPLTLEGMNVALALRQDSSTYEGLRLISQVRFSKYIRNLCGLFFTLIDSQIYLLNQTAEEFLVGNDIIGTNTPDMDARSMLTKR